MSDLICYCFGFTVEDIRQDAANHGGRSTIMEWIVAEKKRGTCRCATMHPEGR